ncbi:MAG: glycosyl hydrolase family 95 catalytic domain-containing protein [Kiritimatiellia bacterium]
MSNHTIVFTRPAGNVPTGYMVDGPLLGNGDIGVVVAGPPEQLRFYIGKNDFWGIRTQAPMTVGQIELLVPDLAGASYKGECDMRRAYWQGSFGKASTSLTVRAWVDANANRLFIELANAGKTPLALAVNPIKGVPVATNSLWFLHDPDTGQPNARKVAVATRILGEKSDANGITLAPGRRAIVVAAILTDLDAKDPLPDARNVVAALTPEKAADAAAAHEVWWEAFWKKSFIEIPDKVLEQHWYAAQYIMGCCSRAGKVAPGLWGNWITTDGPAWHGDFHLNYNFQAPFYGVYAANHAELSLPFYQAINEFVPRGRKIAEKKGWKGVHFPVSIGPWGMCPEGDDTDWGQRSNAAYCALNFIWYYQYIQDEQWLKTAGYPFLREVADFWEDYLKLENGRYVIRGDSIHEGSGTDVNPIMSLGFVKTLFRNMVVMSRDLGLDEDRRAKWQDICEKLSAFPTQDRGGRTVFRYTEKGMDWCDGNTLGIQHIFPGGAIGLDSDPKLLEISRNMADAMARWEDGNGSSSWYTFCARIGYDPKTILTRMRAMTDRVSMPNKLLRFGGGGIENVAGFHAITEMLLQSHERMAKSGNDGSISSHVIRLFPCWPRDMDARFGTLRACGAFLVSAELKGGEVGGVTIRSDKGRDCTVVNPWSPRKVQVNRNGDPAEEVSGERFTLKTSANETIELIAATSHND